MNQQQMTYHMIDGFNASQLRELRDRQMGLEMSVGSEAGSLGGCSESAGAGEKMGPIDTVEGRR